MIAKPLEWNDRYASDGEFYANSYAVLVNLRTGVARARLLQHETLATFKGSNAVADAKAACERHYQKEFLRQMSRRARDLLDYAITSSFVTTPAEDGAHALIIEVNAEESQ